MDEEGIHLHCLNCYASSCFQHARCPVIHCRNQCGVKYHSCKQDEHQLVCTRQLKSCINVSNGCPFKVDSVSLMSHLESCPASVVQCSMSWNRYPLYSKIREQWLPFWQGNPFMADGDLDAELAASDQLHLNREMTKRIKSGNKPQLAEHQTHIGKIEKLRIQKLQSLLGSTSEESNTVEVTSLDPCAATLDDGDNSNEEDTDVFVTYDEVVSENLNMATVVSTTDMRTGYYDLPSNYRHHHQSERPVSRKSQGDASSEYIVTEEFIDVDADVRREKCLNLHSKLKPLGVPLGVNIVMETMPKFQNQYPMYSFSCSKVFRRDQFSWHCRNIHADIQSSLNDFMMQRCPLAHYGCPYVQFRLKPVGRTVRFLRPFASFTSTWDSHTENSKINEQNIEPAARLQDLPFEVLGYMIGFLDSLSLNCLAKTCHLLRDACYGILDNRGIVLTTWTKKVYESTGSTSWKEENKMRFFTTAASPMREWCFTDVPPIGNHMIKCPFFVRKTLTNAVKLPMNGVENTIVKPKIFKYVSPQERRISTSSESSESSEPPNDGVVNPAAEDGDYPDNHGEWWW